MANDCLVTKLKANVDNNSLSKLGEIIFARTAGSEGSMDITFSSTTPLVVRVIQGTIKQTGIAGGDVTLDLGENELTGSSRYYLKCGANSIFGLKVKYSDKVTAINSGTAVFSVDDFEDFKYLANLSNATIASHGRDMSALADKHLTYLVLHGSVDSPITNFMIGLSGSKATLQTYANYMSKDNAKLYDLSEFGAFTALTTLGIFSPEGQGSVESFVSARLVAVPNTAGSITIQFSSATTGITYEGTPLPEKYVGATSKTFTWDAQGNITVS